MAKKDPALFIPVKVDKKTARSEPVCAKLKRGNSFARDSADQRHRGNQAADRVAR